MTKEEVLEQGYLEAYIMGDLSADDQSALEDLLSKDVDLKNKLEVLERDFEQMAFDNAIEPPKQVKRQLQKTLDQPKVRLPYRPCLLYTSDAADD